MGMQQAQEYFEHKRAFKSNDLKAFLNFSRVKKDSNIQENNNGTLIRLYYEWLSETL